jgi:ATP-dependent protease ClpP protease subunit
MATPVSSSTLTTQMPSKYDDDRSFFLNEFDESIDEIMLNIAHVVNYGKGKVSFYINSEGGDSTRAMSVVSLIEVAKAKGMTVETVVLNQAYSSGSLVAIAGSKGHRIVAPSATYMLHYGETEVIARGPVELQRITAANNLHFNIVRRQYLKYTNMGIEALDEALQYDNNYVTAEQAIELGFADKWLHSSF